MLQFLKTVDAQGRAVVENDQGERVPLHITSKVIVDALHVSCPKGKDLTRWIDKHEKEFIFHMRAGRELTYADMRDPNMEPTLRLINHYTIFGKSPRFTHPNIAIVAGLQLALYHKRPTLLNYAAWIHQELMTYGADEKWARPTNSVINSPHLITRILYHALGITSILPPASRQMEYIANLRVAVGVPPMPHV